MDRALNRCGPGATRAQAGYVLLTVVLLGALILSLTMGLSRHALLAFATTDASMQAQLADTALGSGLTVASRRLGASSPVSLTHALDGGGSLSVDVTPTADDLRQIAIATSADGRLRVVNAVAEVYPSLSEALPYLNFNARRAVWEFPGLIDITSDTKYEDADVTGILLIRKGRKLTLKDVIVRGSIVSENALSDETWDAGEATEIKIEGGVLIEPGSTLAGCAIIAPDAAIDGGHSDAALQVHGVVVVDSIELTGPGVFHAQLVSATDPVLGPDTEFPGANRSPGAWPTSLDASVRNIKRLVFPFDVPDASTQSRIATFPWPTRLTLRGDSADGGAQSAQQAQGGQAVIDP